MGKIEDLIGTGDSGYASMSIDQKAKADAFIEKIRGAGLENELLPYLQSNAKFFLNPGANSAGLPADLKRKISVLWAQVNG